jgi:hypothetical protein
LLYVYFHATDSLYGFERVHHPFFAMIARYVGDMEYHTSLLDGNFSQSLQMP